MSQSAILDRFLTLLNERKTVYGGAIVRLALTHEQGGDKLCFGRLDFSEGQKTSPSEIDLDYGNFRLTHTWLSLDEVVSLMKGLTQDNARLRIKQLDLPVKGNLSPPSLRYVASLQAFGAIRPHWPSTLYYFQVDGNLQGYPPQHPLVKFNLPSYPDGNQAVTEFCELSGGFGQGQIIVVLPDFRARLKQLRVQEGKLSVDVETWKESPSNLRVKFYVESDGKPSRSTDLAIENGRAEFVFNGALHFAMAHLVLTKTGDDIDNRLFAPYYSREGIVVEASELRVKELANAGEGLLVEFKEKLPPDEHHFLDSVIAFANTSGGAILIGVSDHGEIVGVEKNPEEIRETITNWISEKCDPRPSFTINQIEVDGKTVIVVDVASGPSKPYQDLDRGFLVRKGASNRQARRSEVEEMFRSHQVARYA
jgi:hypothetical protein